VALEEKAAQNEAEKLCWTQSRPCSLVEIMRFCARNCHTTVDLRELGFEIITRDGDLQAYKFLGGGMILTMALRGQDITFMAPEFNGVEATRVMYLRLCRERLGEHYGAIESLQDSIGNLRLFPRHVEWDHDQFCKGVLATWKRITPSPHTLPTAGSPYIWLDYAKKWMPCETQMAV
jgi:hypothetical protein